MSLDQVPSVSTDSISSRLYKARWVLLAAAVFFLGLAMSAENLWRECLAGFGVILIASLMPSQSGTDVTQQSQKSPTARTWPDLGMKSVCDALGHPAYILDGTGNLRYANDAAEAAFGAASTGDPISYKFRRPEIARVLAEGIEKGQPAEIEYHDTSPPERWYWMSITPVPGAGQEGKDAEFFLLSFVNLTEAKRSEQMRSDFIANASHELRTPLASLRGFVETLQGPAADDPKVTKEFLTVMLGQAERMSRLIDDLLSLSKIEMKAHLRPSDKVDLVSILRHVADSLKPLAENLGVDIKLDFPRSKLIVEGDRDELVQVFENLLENALKYGQSGGKVDISGELKSTDTGENAVEIFIRDFGPGIPEEHLPRLTERFYRVDVESSREKQGTGLGLAIVKHILTRHATRLNVSSTLGEGAAFGVEFELPEQDELVD
ncbi:MAG: sensor histidine kinase [Rhizobiaceae bacterium]